MWLRAFAYKLESENVGRVDDPDRSIFLFHMNSDVKKGVVLVTPLTGTPRDEELPGFVKGSFQVIVRDQKHEDGYDRCLAVIEALTVKEQIDLFLKGSANPSDTVRVLRCHARHEPASFPRSPGGHVEWSLNFDVVLSAD